LIALIIAFAPRSGAHFNPVVSGALALRGDFPAARLAGYVAAQFVGALLGVLAAHAMFDLPLLQASVTLRSSPGQWLSEAVATRPGLPGAVARPQDGVGGAVRGRQLHCRGLLVYGVHLLRQPGAAWRTCRPS